MKEERRIRDTVKKNPERGRLIFEIRRKIHDAISYNRAMNMAQKIQELQESKNPQCEIFKIRRERQKRENLGFTLKDRNGRIQVGKEGIDMVVKEHFQSVFAQNPKPKGELWKMYWKEVDELFASLIKVTGIEAGKEKFAGPSFEEVNDLIRKINIKKSVTGNMSGDHCKDGTQVYLHLLYERRNSRSNEN